jgi:hypothetical protein
MFHANIRTARMAIPEPFQALDRKFAEKTSRRFEKKNFPPRAIAG